MTSVSSEDITRNEDDSTLNAKKVEQVARISGATVNALPAITATTTSSPINLTGYNGARFEVEVTATSSGTWTPVITGSETSGGTYGTIYCQSPTGGGQVALTLPALSSVKKEVYIISGLPNFVKISETLSGGTGTVNVNVIPFIYG